MELAQFVENQRHSDQSGRSYSSGNLHRTTTTFLPPKGATTSLSREILREKAGSARLGVNFKRLTEGEMQEKRTKGLCFRCDERYAPGHRCKDQTLQVLTVCDEEELEEGGESDIGMKEEKLHLEVAEVSLNFVVGLTSHRTMKVRGEIADRKVIVLIDSGAGHPQLHIDSGGRAVGGDIDRDWGLWSDDKHKKGRDGYRDMQRVGAEDSGNYREGRFLTLGAWEH